MDRKLLEYLRSGEAWVLLGSGPSIRLGYPTWENLARLAREELRLGRGSSDSGAAEAALRRGDFPAVFEAVAAAIGLPQLLDVLRPRVEPRAATPDNIYRLIAQWPIPVYLTTNFDDELQRQFADLGVPLLSHTNSPDHMALLTSDLRNALFKLHGDLRSTTGLVLTTSQYDAVMRGTEWEHFRRKLEAVFSMARVIIVGHSLSDPHFKHILAAARIGAGIVNPVIWIAPDVSQDEARQYLEDYRIRVVSYENRDGSHRQLEQLLRAVSEFVPPRNAVRLRETVRMMLPAPSEPDPAAPGLHVFNVLHSLPESSDKQVAVISAAIAAVLPGLARTRAFAFHEALRAAGWPAGASLAPTTEAAVLERLTAEGLVVRSGLHFSVDEGGLTRMSALQSQFHHLRAVFQESLRLRLRRTHADLSPDQAAEVVSGIDTAMIGFFRQCGLSLVTTLFPTSGASAGTAPLPLFRFINEYGASYKDFSMRHAFLVTAVDVIVHSEAVERNYLGRLSQGFFAFHLLGAFGSAAADRIARARETVWLVDSSLQIPALAVGTGMHVSLVNGLQRFKEAGIRLFTTDRLFAESAEHLWFAQMVIRNAGGSSSGIVAAARGDAPYRKGNLYLQGFVAWRAAGRGGEWESYLHACFGSRQPTLEDQKARLHERGIECIPFQAWSGFTQNLFERRAALVEEIGDIREGDTGWRGDERDSGVRKKAEPEAEAVLLVRGERAGTLHLISQPAESSPAWFISATSVLNAVDGRDRITWQPEAFLRFASTIYPPIEKEAADDAFEALLWGVAQSGLDVLPQSAVEAAFGARIEESNLALLELREAYDESLAKKYGEPIESVLRRVPIADREIAAVQLSKEIAQAQQERLRAAESGVAAERARATRAEAKLREVESFRKKLEKKKGGAKKRARKQKAASASGAGRQKRKR